jgi:hypothetical protein
VSSKKLDHKLYLGEQLHQKMSFAMNTGRLREILCNHKYISA